MGTRGLLGGPDFTRDRGSDLVDALMTLRTRLARAAWDAARNNGTPEDVLDAVLVVLASPSDADVERVAVVLADDVACFTMNELARAAIRALVGGEAK